MQRPGTLQRVRIELEHGAVEVRLSWWQKLFGLMRNMTVPLADVEGAEVVADGVRVAGRAGLKFGLRVPLVYFVARTIRLDEAFVVRRGVPALSLSIGGDGPLRRLLVSTPRAEELARAIEAARRS